MKMGMACSLAGLGVLTLALASAASSQPSTCCFTNPGYAGTCEVARAKRDTCASVLAYLNNPMSSGKNYCNSTAIRGGWELATCEAPPPKEP